MSDGSLSQDEIDALLQGSGEDFADAGPAPSSGPNLGEFQKLLESTTEAQSSNLSGLMGDKSVTIQKPTLSRVSLEDLKSTLPGSIVQINIDFEEDAPGRHAYVLNEDDASVLAGLIVGQEQVEMSEMALEALKEALSTVTGVVLTTFGDMISGTIMPSPAEATQVGGGELDFSDPIVQAAYSVQVEGQQPIQLLELFEPSIVEALTTTTQGPQPQQSPQQQQVSQPQPSGGGMGGMEAMFGGPPAGGGQPGQQGGGRGSMMGGTPPNVQSVQFPSFAQQNEPPQESGNISLLMDVYMEMTVELGRTKKPIKEILGMGEGTIIELDKLAGEPVDILVNHKLIATGEVVVIDENFGVRVTEIVSPSERMKDLT
ncbi:MAG: flagellar motor switch protein FliN [Spirochaetota bacterium]